MVLFNFLYETEADSAYDKGPIRYFDAYRLTNKGGASYHHFSIRYMHTCIHAYMHTYIHTYIVNLSELLCLIPILVATACPPERDTALRTAVTTITREPL